MPYVSISWLRDHVQVPEDQTIADVAEDLVAVGLEEEEIHPPKVTGPLVAGKVLALTKEEHSNGKTVNYCRVDVGSYNDAPGTGKEKSDLPSRGIICGAHNFKVGDTVVVSLPGAVLPGPFPIAARKTYGHVSDGMICSERELGLGNDHDGIIVLNDRFGDQVPQPGTNLISLLGLGEEVLEINVTPDRGYCFAMRGIAREYALSTGQPFVDPGIATNLGFELPAASSEGFVAEVAAGSSVEGRAACDRFVTQIVRGIDPQARTPQWMVERLEQAGMRSLSLPVDVTNYVMLDLGQPLHAYALEYVSAPFVVRRAVAGEKFLTLDGVDRQLNEEDLVIADSPEGNSGSRIVGLAGVMGGEDSEVSAATTDVVIEGAHFDPISIARTSRRHRLSSEASKRFERGVDFNLAPIAVARVANLLAEYGGGVAETSFFDFNQTKPLPQITLSVTEPARLTGVNYSKERIVELLEAIGATVTDEGQSLTVQPPSWRSDLVGAAHLVEEVARLDGYDNIPVHLPRARHGIGSNLGQWVRRKISDTAAQAGVVEVLSYPFIGDAHDRQLIEANDIRRNAVRLRNPLADDAPALRTTILDTLLDTAARNASRSNQSLSIFELGSVTLPASTVPAAIPGVNRRPNQSELAELKGGVPAQPWHFAAVMGGPQGPSAVLSPSRQWDWADGIALAQRLSSAIGVTLEATRAWLPSGTKILPGPPVPPADENPNAVAPWHPGRVARLYARKGKDLVVVGLAGELHPRVIEEYGLPPLSAAIELDLEVLTSLVAQTPVKAKKVSVYPPAKIDLAVVVDEAVPATNVERVIRGGAGQLLESLQLFDIYSGEQVEAGHRSLAFSVTLRASDRTLSAGEVSQIRDKMIHDLHKRLKAELRA